jgi:Papain family cysteine protease
VDLTRWAMPVGDQGQIGDCAAWATVYTALGEQENRARSWTPQGSSAIYAYSQTSGGVDQGSTLEDNLNVAVTQGVDSRADYGQGRSWRSLPTSRERSNARRWKLSGFQAIGYDQNSIEQALAAGEPVPIVIPVTEAFMYAYGVAHYPAVSRWNDSVSLGLHAVTILAYSPAGVRIENSWGTHWGDHGWVTISWAWLAANIQDAIAVGPMRSVNPAPAPRPHPHHDRRGSGTASGRG